MGKMSETLIHLPDLSDKEGVIDRIVEGLGRVPIDYVERSNSFAGETKPETAGLQRA